MEFIGIIRQTLSNPSAKQINVDRNPSTGSLPTSTARTLQLLVDGLSPQKEAYMYEKLFHFSDLF